MAISDSEMIRLRAVTDVATNGPWEYTKGGVRRTNSSILIPHTLEDVEFIADARTAMPALLDEVDRLTQLLRIRNGIVDPATCDHPENRRITFHGWPTGCSDCNTWLSSPDSP